ncbi:hypothetical protein Agub_g9116 [Astrephomene gubernaculifera]|uniref:Peptidase M20 dimerisation domain-containing protein n=1 Tax=Astrephomene gubernaculifera TaxID=47775 RepID=A0AAD3DSQ0_9CHLO|nr:hypothetical protein Agub_g9116 [Astrephomene gubernaculifera]
MAWRRHLLVAIALLATLGLVVGKVRVREPLMRRVLYDEPNAHLKQLAKISDTEGSLARTFFSPAHRRAAQQLIRWMQDCGMETWADAVGNVHGRIRSARDGAQELLLGSHYDTVLDGGAYDGALGILVGLAAVKGMLLTELMQRDMLDRLQEQEGGEVVISASLASSLMKQGAVHLVAFADEEGVRFQSTFLGSRAVAGTLLRHDMLAAKDHSGATLEQVLREEGGLADPRVAVAAAALNPALIAEYVEVHIEQGPVLESKGLPLGVVVGIAGQTRLWVHVNGTQGHAGTVPMAGRRDALTAAAEIVLAIESMCNKTQLEGGVRQPQDDSLVCTVGELRVWPGASNVIPGYAGLSVDLRSKNNTQRHELVRNVSAAVKKVCKRRGVKCGVERKHDAESVMSDPGVIEGMSVAAAAAEPMLMAALTDSEAAGVLKGLRSLPKLVSGAGHDAMAIAETIPRMGMMFVRCRGGVSHSPLEHVEPVDVAASSAALSAYLWGRLVGGMLGSSAPDPRVRGEL